MIYLDNTATTVPKPECVPEEISKCIRHYCGNPGRSTHTLSMQSAEKIYDTRHLLADMFDCDEENVVFTYNTTYALNLAIKSLITAGSHVLISDIEHNSVYRPVSQLARNSVCSFSIFDTAGSDDDILKSILSSIHSNTKMLVCTHVSNIGSRRLPLSKIGELCEKLKITFIVDAAQSAGIYDISVKKMKITALCMPAHKGLYGPQGLGMILFNTNEIRQSVIEGGTGINSMEVNMPSFLPEGLEAGTQSTPSIAGLNASLRWLKNISLKQIRAHEEALYGCLVSELRSIPNVIVYEMNNYPGNTLIFNVKGLPSTRVASNLNDEGICVRGGYHCSPLAHKVMGTLNTGAVRVGFSVFNSKNEIICLKTALNKIANKK